MIRLIFEFLKTGLLSMGGGLATLPFLQEMVGKYDWFTADELITMIAISESTPGPFGVNMATFAGFNAYGMIGAFLATVALVTPSIIICVLISKFLAKNDLNNIFKMLRPVSIALIISAVFSVFSLSLNSFISVLIFSLLFILIKKAPKLHPIIIILIGGVIGAVFL